MDVTAREYVLLYGDCVARLRDVADGTVNLVLTSPPYDSLRTYGDSLSWDFDTFTAAAREIYRVMAKGAVCVWIVGDATRNGTETGTSFRQALHFKELGLNLHDTMIYAKTKPVPLTHNRYEQQFDYMFVFSKGRPATFHGLREPCKFAGTRNHMTHRRDGESLATGGGYGRQVKDTRLRYNIWYYATSRRGGGDYRHPAVFPVEMARDHIATWTNPGDLVVDPFVGTGTTGEAAIAAARRFVGVEKHAPYFAMAVDRLAAIVRTMTGTLKE